MDCLVTITGSDEGRVVDISGSAAVRFKKSMEKKINAVLDGMNARESISVNVQDNGALDVVLGARVEAAYNRYRGCVG
jgi:citrate lyase subunit gamma (acyl carrier protein)